MTNKITANDINWWSFEQTRGNWLEGPSFRGNAPFQLPSNPTDDEKVLAVVTSTESSNYSAINMWDRAIVSVGIIQLIESGLRHVSSMIKIGYQQRPDAVRDELEETLFATDFELNDEGKFVFKDTGRHLSNDDDLRAMYFAGCSGKKGTWLPYQKKAAKTWACSLANLFGQPFMVDIQSNYVTSRLSSFVFSDARLALFDKNEEPIAKAVRAVYTSFAANLPAVANKMVRDYRSTQPKWSEQWVTGLLRKLTFDPGIAFYPGRYETVRRVADKLYGVTLPKFNTAGSTNLEEIQTALAKLGYYTGVVDGIQGPMTKNAIINFQKENGLVPDGIVGPKSLQKLQEMSKG